ncbi:MAG: ATP-binding cassette domain-containing protein, partial [Anaerolineae bacterium]|nr:ATP-binding cassette domain-containing protein [Anaerolineae bacterium]
LIKTLSGVHRPTRGEMWVDGKRADFSSPRDALDAGIVLLTNDRLREGLLPESPIWENVTLPVLGRFAGTGGILDLEAMLAAGRDAIKKLTIRAPGPTTLARALSGGNQQKVLFAKWLATEPRVFIMDEPTIGIDPQQVIEVRDAVRELGQDHTVLLSTHILSEAEQVCDRVIIINKGHIVAQGKPAELRRKLQPEMHLYIVLGGKKDRGEKLLRSIPGIEAVEAAGEGFNVRVKKGADIRTELIDQALRAGYTIQEMRPVMMTLENMFLDIIGREA